MSFEIMPEVKNILITESRVMQVPNTQTTDITLNDGRIISVITPPMISAVMQIVVGNEKQDIFVIKETDEENSVCIYYETLSDYEKLKNKAGEDAALQLASDAQWDVNNLT